MHSGGCAEGFLYVPSATGPHRHGRCAILRAHVTDEDTEVRGVEGTSLKTPLASEVGNYNWIPDLAGSEHLLFFVASPMWLPQHQAIPP